VLAATLRWEGEHTRNLGCRIGEKGSHHRYATAKLAAESHDLAAFNVRGESAVTNVGIAAARNAWQVCPQTYSPVLQRSLQAAIARLHDIGAGGGAKAACSSGTLTRELGLLATRSAQSTRKLWLHVWSQRQWPVPAHRQG